MAIFFARTTRSALQCQFTNVLDESPVNLPLRSRLFSPLGPLKRAEIGSHVWVVIPSGTRAPFAAADFLSIPDNDVHDGAPLLVDALKAFPARKHMDEMVGKMLGEIAVDQRIGDTDKLLILGNPAFLTLLPGLAPSLPTSLHAPLCAALELRNKWLDIDAPLTEATTILTDILCEPDDIVALRDGRSRLQQERADALRRQEEEQRAREEAEKKRLEEEERIKKEREQALRAALTLRPAGTDPDTFVMTDEFQHVFELVEGGKKLLFVTGKPGTGKSTLIRALMSRLANKNIVVLSFTGTAALNIGGQTINSFFMMPPRILDLGWQCDKYKFKIRAQALEVLVVDEVSMIRPDMLDAMDSALRFARGDQRPFGGVQMVLVGDLHQLPPIIDSDGVVQAHYKKIYDGARWFFAAKVFAGRHINMVELTTVFRQKAGEFLDFLAEVRNGSVTGERLDWFNNIVRTEEDFSSSVFYLTVTPRRRTADGINRQRLDELGGPSRSWAAYVDKKGTIEEPKDADTRYPADTILELKQGAQVMMIKNDTDKRWVNGDLGIVEGFSADRIRVTTGSGTWNVERVRWPMIRYELDEKTHHLIPVEDSSFVQFPVKLAWAATIHKMQGQTVDRIKIDLTGGAFESGMTYVALSRCRTMEGIRLTRPLLQADILFDEAAVSYLKQLEKI